MAICILGFDTESVTDRSTNECRTNSRGSLGSEVGVGVEGQGLYTMSMLNEGEPESDSNHGGGRRISRERWASLQAGGWPDVATQWLFYSGELEEARCCGEICGRGRGGSRCVGVPRQLSPPAAVAI